MQLSPIEWAKFACDSLMDLYAAQSFRLRALALSSRCVSVRDGDVVGGCTG